MPVKFENKVNAARKFAELVHMDKRYGEHPYSFHLYNVVDTLVLHFNVTDKDVLCAGFLHDAVEDTGVSLMTIQDLFGARVAELVFAVTDEEGANRKERKAKTYPKIKRIAGATQIKLADRIANVEHALHANNAPMYKMYEKEQAEFQTQLRVLGEYDDMWAYLDKLLIEGQAKFVPAVNVVPTER